MEDFWTHYYWGQDVMIVCLEIQQRFLYDHLRHSFLREIRLWESALVSHVGTLGKKSKSGDRALKAFSALRKKVTLHMDMVKDLKKSLLTQIREQTKDNEKVVISNERCDFVDLLLRFFLFQENLNRMYMRDEHFIKVIEGEKNHCQFGFVDEFPAELYAPVPPLDRDGTASNKHHRHLTPTELEALIKFEPTQQASALAD